LFQEQERAQVTLNSIGDAVISTDLSCHVTYLNLVAERMTGWSREQAAGRPLADVFRIFDATTRAVAQNPMVRAIRENQAVGLMRNCVLIRRDGEEAVIEDSAAPIHDRSGQVLGAVMVFRDVTVLRATSLKVLHLAHYDSLTDLPNRVLLHERLASAIAFAQRHGRKLALLFADVDRFKQINDSLGHSIGDRLLQSVASRLVASVRASDTVSRQGGDEFVILLPEVAQAQDAGVTAEKILLALRLPHLIDEHVLHLTASIGIVRYPEDGTDAGALLKNADLAMYHAKNSGRNNYQFFKADMCLRVVERQTIESALRNAIERHELQLFYQPQMDLLTGAISGVEALIRWRHFEHGTVSAAQLISIAEECGLIVPIGRWVLREACSQGRAWQKAGFPAMCIAINVSAVELCAKDFVSEVRSVLAETGLAASLLEFELTESFLVQDSRLNAVVLQELKQMGVRLALDDFGTGYSSLSYLKRLPIDTIKIDQSFVQDLGTDRADASIVCAIIDIGRSLEMKVIAEGVETREQLEFLQQHGCPSGQGFYFGQPAPRENFTDTLIRAERRRALLALTQQRPADVQYMSMNPQ
jgi:diguanylate cyclase (GGDEF)-like protein/PAS domain S-box-containing protein